MSITFKNNCGMQFLSSFSLTLISHRAPAQGPTSSFLSSSLLSFSSSFLSSASFMTYLLLFVLRLTPGARPALILLGIARPKRSQHHTWLRSSLCASKPEESLYELFFPSPRSGNIFLLCYACFLNQSLPRPGIVPKPASSPQTEIMTLPFVSSQASAIPFPFTPAP